MKTTFILKEPNSQKETLIYLIIRVKEERVKISISEQINPKFWNKNENRAKETKQFREYPEFNTRLDYIESIVKTVYRKYLNDNSNNEPSLELLKRLVISELRPSNTSTKISYDLISYAEHFISEAKNRINPKTKYLISDTTIRVYKRCIFFLTDYCKKINIKSSFDVIDLKFCLGFKQYLIELDLSTNTVAKHLKTFKTFLNEATAEGLNKNHEFRSRKFYVNTEDVEDIYLNEIELESIYKLDLKDNLILDEVRDLFIIACWTGLRYSDFSRLTSDQIKGDYIYIKETKKTKVPALIPLHWTAKEIIKKYSKGSALNFPKALSNPQMNKKVKDIGELVPALHVEVNKTITKKGVKIITPMKKFKRIKTHTCRRSFATNLYNQGVLARTIMAITTHKTEKAFFQYIKITPEDNAKTLKAHFDQNFKQKMKNETKRSKKQN